MTDDVVDLRDFYATSLGQVTRRIVRRKVRTIWPDVTGLSIAGFGYATPYLRPFKEEATRTVALMPAAQGVLRWPRTPEPNVTTLVEPGELPLPDLSMDRFLIVHALETAEQLRVMLREVWRVLAGSGRLLIVVPNRRGIWARLDRTPFGSGQPYTASQLSRLLRDNLFTPVDAQTMLHVPPTASRMVLSSAPAFERLGQSWFPSFAGLVVMEATKQIYAATPVAVEKRRQVRFIPSAEPSRPNLPMPQRRD